MNYRIAIIVARRYALSTCAPRSPSSINLFGSYDGNVIGGLLLGAGMTLTGACPGKQYFLFRTFS
jgi:uncharacterized membrane protein YedE/YeeE